jgi:hypothetical protein
MVRKTIGSYISVLEKVNLGIKDLRPLVLDKTKRV